MPQHTAKLNHLRMAPRKVRLVADMLRGLPLNEAEARLSLDRHRAARPLLKLLRSAANGAAKKEMNLETLYVSTIRVDNGPMLKRYMPRAQGRGAMIQKKSSHIILGLDVNPSQKPARFVMPERPKKTAADREAKRASRAKKAGKPAPEGAAPEKRPEKPGFFKKTFGRRSGEA